MKLLAITLPLFLLMTLPTTQLHAGAPTCHAVYNGYCEYKGKVKSIYINSGNSILLFFDTPLAEGTSEIAGLNATQSAAAVLLNENPEFAKLFYSTALTAQASGREVSIQMRGTFDGYLKLQWI
jgi:hypothetical protein